MKLRWMTWQATSATPHLAAAQVEEHDASAVAQSVRPVGHPRVAPAAVAHRRVHPAANPANTANQGLTLVHISI
jgi:hypothetical protein